ncbi:MAG: hypothetical protein GY846_26660, partial [Deltaproteobacteria bacterium]|nr:hypothetical protein [Deltaproteobacteria bacterium]
EVETFLADPNFFEDSVKSVPLLAEYKEASAQLESLLEKWEGCHDKMESAKTSLEI